MKYQRFTPAGGKNMGIRKSEFVTKSQFLSYMYLNKIDFLLLVVKSKQEKLRSQKVVLVMSHTFYVLCRVCSDNIELSMNG